MMTRHLTPTEERVARLVADGRTQPEVAHELGLRPTAVRWHVARVHSKLGTRSRAELVELLAGLPEPTDPPTLEEVP